LEGGGGRSVPKKGEKPSIGGVDKSLLPTSKGAGGAQGADHQLRRDHTQKKKKKKNWGGGGEEKKDSSVTVTALRTVKEENGFYQRGLRKTSGLYPN